MPRPPEPLPPQLGGVFSVADGVAAGVSRSRLRASDLRAPFRGVRSVGVIEPLDDGLADAGAVELRHRIDAYATTMPRDQFFTHLAALVVWCRMLPASSPLVDVGVMVPGRTPRAVGVRGHRVTPRLAHTMESEGLRVTTPASTWAQLATVLDVRDLVAVGSMLATRPRSAGGTLAGPALTTVDALAAATCAGPRRGVEKLRAALPIIRPGARSRPEGHLLYEFASAGLPVPELDVEIYDARGALIGIGDLAYRAQRVFVEYQGDYHRRSRAAWAADIRKRERAREAGWTPVELSAADLYPSAAPAVERVRHALRAAGLAC